jgi:ABC-type lipoprotein release transport system permease subunit
LKALGFTPRQLASVVAWQSTVTAIVGIIVGVPLGIVIGRQLWTVFADNINAVPDPTVPVLSVVLVAVGALVFANAVAAIPGRIAGRTPTAMVLRAE